MKPILFTSACLYKPNEITLYGHHRERFNSITLGGAAQFELVFCTERPDFYIKIMDVIDTESLSYYISNLSFYFSNETVSFSELTLQFPFEKCSIDLSNPNASIISTLCKNYSHRLDEWIQYHLKLGFSGIVIFNNGGNASSGLNESLENTVFDKSMEQIASKYDGRVFLVDFPYGPFPYDHWNNIQRASLTIGVNAFREKCRFISLTDADEFIYLPANPTQNIEDFLQSHNRTIKMHSNVLTNHGANDVINNNVLELAKYVGEDKYTKAILCTSFINENEFIITPHEHGTQLTLGKDVIIHYHCWLNERYGHNDGMQKIEFLNAFLST